jgi:Tol biopolymer transport system component
MSQDGSGKRQLTSPPANIFDLHPAFSPDGKRIVFERGDNSGATRVERVWVVNVDGSDAHLLVTDTPSGFNDEGAAFSPDGTKLAFQRAQDGPLGVTSTGQVMLANADGSGATALTTPPNKTTKDGDPNFSPDGKKVAFVRAVDSGFGTEGTSQVRVINTDGSGEADLSNDTAFRDEDPAFSPDGTLIAFSRATGTFFTQHAQIYTMRPDGSGKQSLSNNTNVFDQKPDWQPLANVVSTAQIPPCVAGTVTVAVGDTTGFKSPPRGVHYRLDFGAEQVALTDGGTTATIALPAGRHELEYWGQNQAGDQEREHHNVVVTVDQTKPTVVISSDQGRATFRRGQFASVTIRASDPDGTLVRNPSRRHLRISTAGVGTHTVRATATDACGNTATARLTYRVVKAAVAHRRVVVRPRFTG